MENNIKTYVIDLFCGFGGTTTGIAKAGTNIEVKACINHDANAIRSHSANYPNCLHFTEDIRTISLSPIVELVNELRRKDPTCKIAIWASLECTNFSRAKCGPKVADSRTLAEDLERYLEAFSPDFLWIENVEEFLLWGPLDEDGNPIKEQEGESYQKWVDMLTDRFFCNTMFQDTLIAADYGGRTIRKRLFLQFTKDPAEIGEPIQTHSKDGKHLPKWLPVKDILDLTDHGKSIFTRKKLFVKNTHRRIFKGLDKFGPKDFGYKYYGQLGFQKMDDPCCTLTTKDRVSLVHPVFMSIDYVHRIGRSINSPCSTLVTNPREGLVSVVRPVAIKQDYGTSDSRDVNVPMATLTTRPKGDVIFTKATSFVHNPQYGGSNRSVFDPACTIIARQDKAPLGLTTAQSNGPRVLLRAEASGTHHLSYEGDTVIITIFDTDDIWLKRIKGYCYEHQICDVCVRPLLVKEMLQIQGFPEDYELVGTKTEHKKFIGNSVEVKTGIALIQSIDNAIQTNYLNAA